MDSLSPAMPAEAPAAASAAEPAAAGLVTTAGALRAACALAALATARPIKVPVLAHLLLESDDAGATLTGHNLDVELIVALPTEERGAPFVCTIPATSLQHVASSAPPAEPLAIALGKHVGLATEAAAWLIADHFPPTDFPRSPCSTPRTATRFALPASALRGLLAPIEHAISTEPTRYFINGAYLHTHAPAPGRLLAAATDGYRMMRAEAPLPDGAAAMPGIIIPRGAVRILLAALRQAPAETPIGCAIWDAGFVFDAPGWTLRGKAIDGTFPDYGKILADEQAREAPRHTLHILQPAALAEAVASVAPQRLRSEPVALLTGRTGLDLRCENDGGYRIVSLSAAVADWDTPPRFAAGFQARYLRDACAALSAGFTLSVIDGHSPALLKAPGMLGLVMPMRV
jgi:DNA polymerase-3 subunit beta